MKEETYKDEGYKLMGALHQLGSATISVSAERASGQPGGLPELSRGSSASDTPGTPSKRNRTPEGCQNLSRDHPLESLAPLRGASPLRSLSGGIASLRSAQPPANFCEPSGFVPPFYIKILNYT